MYPSVATRDSEVVAAEAGRVRPRPSAPTTLPATTVPSAPSPVALRKDRRLVPNWCCSIPSSSEALAGDQRHFIAVERAGGLLAPVCQALRPRRGPMV